MNESQPTKRRVFRIRFRLRTLLLLPVLFAAGWWWVTWPERTARRFVELLATGDIESAKAMSEASDAAGGFWMLAAIAEKSNLHFERPALDSSRWKERVTGWRRFKIPWSMESNRGTLEGFVACRGRVNVEARGLVGSSIHRGSKVDTRIMATLLSVAYGNNPQFKFTPVPQSKRLEVYLPPSLKTHVSALFAILDPEDVVVTRYSLIPYETKDSKERMEKILEELRRAWKANGEQIITVKSENVVK